MKQATPTVFIDNERVRVTEWRLAPGAETIAELKKGVPYFRDLGVEHDVINANLYEFTFIEVEMK